MELQEACWGNDGWLSCPASPTWAQASADHIHHLWGWGGSFGPPTAAGVEGPCHGMGWAGHQGNSRRGLAQPSELCPVSFLGFIYSYSDWPTCCALLPSCVPCPCPLWDPPSKGLSSGPKEVPGGHMSASLTLDWNFPLHPRYTSERSCRHMPCNWSWMHPAWQAEPSTRMRSTIKGRPKWRRKNWRWHAGMAPWLDLLDLLNDPNGKVLPPEWALCSFWALSKCQFRDPVGKAA